MKFRVDSSSRAPKLALTSMLDVIFLLLCFFVTVSVFSQWENEISITLPSAKTSDEPERLPGEVVVNLAVDGSIRVNGMMLSLDELRTRLEKLARFFPGQSVIVRADRDTTYDHVVQTIDTCREAGIWNFSLATVSAAEEGR